MRDRRQSFRSLLLGVLAGIVALGLVGVVAMVGWRQGGDTLAAQRPARAVEGAVSKRSTTQTLVMQPFGSSRLRSYSLTTATRAFNGDWHQGPFRAAPGSWVYVLLNSSRQIVRMYDGGQNLTGTIADGGQKLRTIGPCDNVEGPTVRLETSTDFPGQRLVNGETVQIQGFGNARTVIVRRVRRWTQPALAYAPAEYPEVGQPNGMGFSGITVPVSGGRVVVPPQRTAVTSGPLASCSLDPIQVYYLPKGSVLSRASRPVFSIPDRPGGMEKNLTSVVRDGPNLLLFGVDTAPPDNQPFDNFLAVFHLGSLSGMAEAARYIQNYSGTFTADGWSPNWFVYTEMSYVEGPNGSTPKELETRAVDLASGRSYPLSLDFFPAAVEVHGHSVTFVSNHRTETLALPSIQ